MKNTAVIRHTIKTKGKIMNGHAWHTDKSRKHNVKGNVSKQIHY